MSWLHYLIEANIYLGVFYLCYCLFLNHDTHYTLGRVYLIFSCIVAFILPLTQVSILKPILPEIEIVALPAQVNNVAINTPPQINIAEPVVQFTFNDALIYLYITGAVTALLVLMYRLGKLYTLIRNKHSLYQGQYKLINLEDENTAFSFFNYLFIGKNIPQAQTIIAHELVHIRQKHSADIIFMEAVKVVNWFNPFIYLMQRSLKTVHEYIADEQTAAHEQDALTYSSFLLNNAYGIQGASIVHSFFNYNLLKKRIIMLNKNRSGKLARLKYLAVLPLCAGMLCASTLVFSKDYGVIDLLPRPEKPITKPDLIKYFKIRDRNITAYSDNLSFTENGVKKTYLAATITNADITYIKKVRKIDVEVIEVDSKTKMQVPMAILPDAKPDTTKMPPPPIALRTSFYDFGRFISIKTAYPKNALAGKKQGGIIISFHVDGSGTVSDVKLFGNHGVGFADAIISSAKEYRGKIKDKAGDYMLGVNFIIPGVDGVQFPKPSVTKAANYVGEVVILGLTDAQRKKLMPPPPLPPTAKPGNVPALPPPPPPATARPGKPAKPGSVPALPPPPPPAPPKATAKVPEIEIEPIPAVAPKPATGSHKVTGRVLPIYNSDKNGSALAITPQPKTNKLAPPPPYDAAYVSLYNHMAKTLRYPQSARENQTDGNVILSYRLNADHKITDIKVVKGIGQGCDEAAIRSLHSYAVPISKPAGEYYMAAIFVLDGYTKKYESLEDYRFKPNFSGTIITVGYADITKAKGKATSKNNTKPAQSDAVVKQTAMNQLIDQTLSIKRIIFPFDKNYQLKKGDRC